MIVFIKRVRRVFTIAAFGLIAFAPAAYTAAPEDMAEAGLSLDELLSIPEVTQVISNGAGDVAWVERQDGGWNLALARAPAYEPQQLTFYDEDDGREMFLVGFRADGAVIFRRGDWGKNAAHAPFAPPVTLFSLSDGADAPTVLIEHMEKKWSAPPVMDKNGERFFAATGGVLWSYDAAGGESPHKLLSVRGVIKSLVVSPAQDRIAFIVDRSNLKRGKYAFVGVYDFSAQTITYMQPGLAIDQDVVWSPSGDKLAFVRFGFEPRTWRFSDHREGVPFEIVVADPASGGGEVVFAADVGYGARFNGFNASTYSGLGGVNNLLWLSDDQLLFPYERTGWKLFYAVSAKGGAARLVTPGRFEIIGAVAARDRSAVYYWANKEDDLARLRLYRLDVAGGLTPRAVVLPAGVDMVSGAHRPAVFPLVDGDFAAIVDGAQTPSQLIVQSPDGDSRKLSSGPEAGDPITLRMPAPEVVSYKAPDGVPIQAILYRSPKTADGGAAPAVVWAHGGSRRQFYPAWNTRHTNSMQYMYLVAKGYTVLVPNYRSGIGFGLDFREPKSYGGRGAGEVQDVIAGAKYLIKNVSGVDPDKIGIVGFSYGGHLVTNALARSNVFAAGVSVAGVGDWVVEMEKDTKETLPYNIPERMKLERRAYASSAISKIDDWGDEPLMLIHGDNDGSAAMQQSLELYLALKRRGKTAEALIFPGEGHQFYRTENIRRSLEAMDAYLQRHMGD
ncbi:MAG: alpha/beta fold hydrolase [Pseudomonadota bacterium]